MGYLESQVVLGKLWMSVSWYHEAQESNFSRQWLFGLSVLQNRGEVNPPIGPFNIEHLLNF